MEECEVLCSKLAILKKGQFQCFGNIQHLKNKYGKGYSLVLKTKQELSANIGTATCSNVKCIEEFISNQIPNAVLVSKQVQTLYYQINLNDNVKCPTISNIFSLIEANKASFHLETFSLSQTTLEQVFLSFCENSNNKTV